MFLKYIEIQGFKSFPDKIRLSFDQVLTGIVGPNGSGKSNISDAVRWVLGEQSTKSLRGGKMEDVIFSGTKMRNPMGFAQVSLCLDNRDHRIADVGDEIIVTRRYYRSGDSEYAINGAQVRLRDLREMFMDTGLGRDGYSIIGQGRIAEVVESKGTDRREVFEEASGIAKYRFRKNEAERKLEQAEDNLSRLRDISGELESRIGPLKEQSAKAEKFLQLSEERKGLEISLYVDTIRRSHDNLHAQDEKIEIARSDYRRVDERMEEFNQQIANLYESNRVAGVQVEESTTGIDERTERITALEAQIAVLRNDVMHGQREIRSLQEDLEALGSGDQELKEQVEKRKEEAAQKLSEVEALDASIAGLEQELQELIESSAQTDQQRAQLAARLNDLQGQITQKQVEIAAAQSVLESFVERENLIQSTLPQEESRKANNDTRLQEVQEDLESLKSQVQAKENEVGGYQLKISSRGEKEEALSARLGKADEDVALMRQKILLLQDLERSNEGYQPPVRKVLEGKENKTLRGIVGTVGSLLEVQPGLELAIETALGAAIQNVVVEDERAAKEAIGFLKENRSGRATFLPLDTIQARPFEHRDRLKDDGVIGLASELVSYAPQYREIVNSLLGRIIIAEDLDYASVIAKRVNYRVRIVTKDGQVINSGGSYTGGFSGRSAGVFSRRGEVEQLEKDIQRILEETAQDRQQKEELTKERVRLEAELTALQSELTVGREDLIRVQAEVERIQVENAALDRNRQIAQEELDRIANGRKERNESIARLGQEIDILTQDVQRMETDLAQADTTDGFMERRARLMETLSERKIARSERSSEAQRLLESAEELQSQGAQALDRVANLQQAIADITKDNETRQEDINSQMEQVQRLRGEIEELRDKIAKSGTKREENDQQVIEIRRQENEAVEERERLAAEISRLEERKEALQNDYNNYLNRLWEEYELTLVEATPLCVPFTNVTELRQQVSSVRNRIRALGNVNVAAIEEYKEVLSRYEFLSTQIQDVDDSRRSLLDLIHQLEEEMKQIFTVSFNAINERFHHTFQELFGGGSANLYLTDENDILESGIELDVQPPGKVIKNLSALSGGEKSLVSIAIYMAILEVNPSPFCILDEIDSALDESNVVRFARYLNKLVKNTQIIAISHRRGTMEEAQVLYGVTMQEDGVSKVLRLSVEEAKLVIEGEQK